MSTSSPTVDTWCRQAIEQYLAAFPEESDGLASFQQLLETGLDLRDRRTAPGHITASAMICDPAARQVFLIHHGTLGRWLQPGGHVEGSELPPTAARREVAEEVGLKVDRLLSLFPGAAVPIDIDSHDIPINERKSELAHTHHDFLFAFEVSRAGSAVSLQAEEVSDGQWFSYDDPSLEARLQRVIHKLVTRQLWPMDAG